MSLLGKSWKTTLAGLLSVVVGAITGGLIPFLGGQPVNWGTVAMGVFSGLVGIFAADHAAVAAAVTPAPAAPAVEPPKV